MLRRRSLYTFIAEFAIMLGVIVTLVLLTTYEAPQSLFILATIIGVILLILPILWVTVWLPRRDTQMRAALERMGLPATAEVLVDGEALKADMLKGVQSYSGPELFLDVRVRVMPDDGSPSYEAIMKAGLLFSYFLRPGSRVRARYDAQDKARVMMFDTMAEIAQRNNMIRQS